MYLQQADLLRGMKRDFIKEFLEVTVKESHDAGDFLFRRGDKADYFFILVKGHVRISIGDSGHVVHIADHTGEAFGWSSLVGRNTYSASAECVVPTKVLRIENVKIQEVLEGHPESGLIFFKRLAKILGGRLLQGYETMSGISQADISLSYGSRQVMEMGAAW
jgi:CRP/FNR family cyclic AMP-dependent transcriptional regulator